MKRFFAGCFLLTWLCSCNNPDEVVVGSKNFTEQIVLGEIAAQQIERKLHIHVRRRFDLGGTLLTHEALVHGQIDLYPEYTGTASLVVLKRPIPEDPARGYMQVKDDYRNKFNLTWLPPLGFNDTFAMVVRQQDAQKLTSGTLSAADSRQWRLGVGYEFLTRPDGLARLNRTYALKWSGTPQTMDLGLLYQALMQRKVDMAAGNSTDALLADSRLAVLTDDRKAFPPYIACLVARRPILTQHPGLEAALTMLSNRIGEETMRGLNRKVDIEHRPVEEVAKDFLANEP